MKKLNYFLMFLIIGMNIGSLHAQELKEKPRVYATTSLNSILKDYSRYNDGSVRILMPELELNLRVFRNLYITYETYFDFLNNLNYNFNYSHGYGNNIDAYFKGFNHQFKIKQQVDINNSCNKDIFYVNLAICVQVDKHKKNQYIYAPDEPDNIVVPEIELNIRIAKNLYCVWGSNCIMYGYPDKGINHFIKIRYKFPIY